MSDSMEKDRRLFIQILSDHINGRVTALQENANWETILSLAQKHDVAGILYYQCRSFIRKEYVSLLGPLYSSALFYYVNRKEAMESISKNLSGLKFCSVKGLDIAQFYPVPQLRTMGDCDIVVSLEDYNSAISILSEMGFNSITAPEEHDWLCEYRDMVFEVHNSLVKKKEYASAEQEKFFNGFEKYINGCTLDWNFHFLFLLMHLRKHFIGGGVGIRQFMDLAVMIKHGPQLDWEWIENKLIELKLQRFEHACYHLIENWFGIIAPVKYEKISKELIDIVTETVLDNGVFGYSNKENRGNKAKNAILFNDGSKAINRVKYLASRLFPSYEKMIKYPNCDFLIGRSYLLPLFWLLRFLYIILGKDNYNRIGTVKSAFVSNNVLEYRKELLSGMGLYDE